jgi:PIN domain nuclease of toxin-antitoxin system
VLLDTHTFIWWDSEPERLSRTAMDICDDEANTLVVSVASLWEMQIKRQLGKLTLNRSLRGLISDHVATGSVVLLPIRPADVFALDQLSSHHRDPFDRLLAAQALTEEIPLLTRDPVFGGYPVTAIW